MYIKYIPVILCGVVKVKCSVKFNLNQNTVKIILNRGSL
jgi:hypothetical protein